MTIRAIVTEIRRQATFVDEQKERILDLIRRGEMTEEDADALNLLLEAIGTGDIQLIPNDD